MLRLSKRLTPYPLAQTEQGERSEIELLGSIGVWLPGVPGADGQISAEFVLEGDWTKIEGVDGEPRVSRVGQRRDELWKETCFEFFLHTSDNRYFETNLSPLGHWNAYEFTAYREGMKKTNQLALEKIETEVNAGRWILRASWQAKAEAALCPEAAMSAVLKFSPYGECEYWAIKHASDRPDFHHRSAFFKLKR